MHKPIGSAAMPGATPTRPEGVQLRARRSPRLIALGVLLVVLGGLAAAAVYSATADHRAVVIMARDVTRGSILQADDVAAAEVPGGFAVDALPAERVVAVDSGNFMGYPSQFLDVPDVAGFCFTQAFQSIGLGFATAIGAAVARPDRVPVLGTGDGGFHMAVADLETAVRLRLPLVVLVYHDASYSAEVHHFGEPDPAVVFPDTDLAALARGFGADGVTVRGVDDLPAMAAAVRECVERPREKARPLVIDAKIASDGGSWWLAEAFRAH